MFDNLLQLNLSFLLLLILLYGVVIIILLKLNKIQKRINNFFKTDNDNNIEQMLNDFIQIVEKNKIEQKEIKNTIKIIENKLEKCIQKVSLVRYNAFEDVGGDLCYALALLNEKNDGVVINSIYSREGCYNYGKKIIDGRNNINKLSNEEITAINNAIDNY